MVPGFLSLHPLALVESGLFVCFFFFCILDFEMAEHNWTLTMAYRLLSAVYQDCVVLEISGFPYFVHLLSAFFCVDKSCWCGTVCILCGVIIGEKAACMSLTNLHFPLSHCCLKVYLLSKNVLCKAFLFWDTAALHRKKDQILRH